MFLFPSQTAAAVTPQVSAVRRTELCLFCTENTQHGPGPQWRVSHLSFYNTDPGFSGVCHYLSTTLTQPAVACVSLSFYNTDPARRTFGQENEKICVSWEKFSQKHHCWCAKLMRDFSQFCTLLWVISYIFIRDAGAPLRPRTRPGNMRTFVVIVTCQHPPDWASNYRKIGILYTPGFAELFRQIYLHLSMRKFNPMTNTFVCSLLLCLRIEHKKCKNASDDPETAKILFRQVTGYVWYD